MSTSDTLFPLDYDSGGEETRKSYVNRIRRGFFDAYFHGRVLDIGFRGAANASGHTIVPHAIGVDTDFPGYDGVTLPFDDNSVDCVASSHCLEHITFAHAAIREWFRVLKVGGHVVCIVPHQYLYEKRKFPPSRFNLDHKHFFTPATLLRMFEEAMPPNSYRVRHLRDNDDSFNYLSTPEHHSQGCYEIEFVAQKILTPTWNLD